MVAPSIFTTEELSQFTLTNCLAFDLVRVESKNSGKIPPCWLCMSEEARSEARQKLAEWFSNQGGHSIHADDLPRSLQHLEKPMQTQILQWQNAELAMKEARLEGNPRAFFAE